MGAAAAGRARRAVALRVLGGPGLAVLLLVGASGCRSAPGPFELLAAARAPGFAPLRVGVAEVDFTPGPGYPLAGYGGGGRRQEFPFWFGVGWPGRLALDLHQRCNGDNPDAEPADMLMPARGVDDPLTARALVLEAGGGPVALVRIDAIESSALLHDRVSELVAPLGFEPARVWISATHTHSGVGGYMRSRAARLGGTDNFRPEVFERLSRACARAIRWAYLGRRRANVAFARARDAGPDGTPQVAVNRRHRTFPEIAPEAIDPWIRLLVFREPGREAPFAVLANYAVHPTVLDTRSYHFSADLAGAIERATERALRARFPGTRPRVLFFNGAEGDVGPRGEHGGHALLERLGEHFAHAAVPAIVAARPLGDRVAVSWAMGQRDLGDPYVVLTPGSKRRFIEGLEHRVTRWITSLPLLPCNVLVWLFGFDEVRFALTPNGAIGIELSLGAYVPTNVYRFHALRLAFEGPGGAPGRSIALVSVPGEALHALGERIVHSARARGAEGCLLLGLTNGALGYIATETEYERGGYEQLTTFYGIDLADRTLESIEGCLEAVGLRRDGGGS